MTDDTLKHQWLDAALFYARRPSSLVINSRKIHRNARITFYPDDGLRLEDCGYTRAKMRALERLYLHESHAAAVALWKTQPHNVAFSTYAHLSKISGIHGKQGPCLQAVTIPRTSRGPVANAVWRTTELFKKFAADIVFLRDTLLPPFGVSEVRCELHNCTVHPLYFTILLPHIDDPVAELERIREGDAQFHRYAVRDMRDLLCGGKTNANFAQAQRVKAHCLIPAPKQFESEFCDRGARSAEQLSSEDEV
jgi:hypothetical protein